jgi:hypothetical protein
MIRQPTTAVVSSSQCAQSRPSAAFDRSPGPPQLHRGPRHPDNDLAEVGWVPNANDGVNRVGQSPRLSAAPAWPGGEAVHIFGRAERIDRDKLARLASSIRLGLKHPPCNILRT